MDPQLKEAITLAAEISKQLITLSTGIIAITVTVTSTFARRISIWKLWLTLIPAWTLFLLTILFALWHLSALTGNLLAQAHRSSRSQRENPSDGPDPQLRIRHYVDSVLRGVDGLHGSSCACTCDARTFELTQYCAS